MEDDLPGDLGSDLLHNMGKIILQVLLTVRSGIVAGIVRRLIAGRAVGVNGIAADLTAGHRRRSRGGDQVIRPASGIVPAVLGAPGAADANSAILDLIVGIAVLVIVGIAIVQLCAVLCHDIACRLHHIIHALCLGIVGGHSVHIDGFIVGSVNTVAIIQADGVGIRAVGIFGDISLGDSLVGNSLVKGTDAG